MTTSNVNELPLYDFSNDKPATEQYPEPKIAEKDILKDAIAKAEAAMAAKSAKRPLVKSKLPSTKKGKAGRIVGISKDENTLLQSLLQAIKSDRQNGMDSYDEIVNKNQDAFNKLLDRYNK